VKLPLMNTFKGCVCYYKAAQRRQPKTAERMLSNFNMKENNPKGVIPFTYLPAVERIRGGNKQENKTPIELDSTQMKTDDIFFWIPASQGL